MSFTAFVTAVIYVSVLAESVPLQMISPVNAWRRRGLPKGSVIIPNPVNRVPGFSMEHLHCLPGFPEMAWPMMEWVLDTCYHDLAGNKEVEYSLILEDAHESELIELMEDLLAKHAGIKIFSLPRFLDNDRRRLELGVKGERDTTRLAFKELKQALTSRNYFYTEQ